MGALSSLISYILSPLLFILLFVPIYIFRVFVILLAKCSLPAGSTIVEARNAMFSPGFASLSPVGALISPFVFTPGVDTSKVFESFVKHTTTYKRLRYYPVLFRLYSFWVPVPEEDFSLKNHIKELSLEGGVLSTSPATNTPSTTATSHHEYLRIKKLLLEEPFAKGQSPWMLHIIRNIVHERYGNCDVVIFKCHHGLADGLSISKLFAADCEPKPPAGINFPPVPAWVSVAMSIKSVFCILENTFGGGGSQPSVISPASVDLKRGNDCYLAESEPIPIEYIKHIKNKNKVSFNCVVLSALSSALRSYALHKEETNIPCNVSTCIVLPYPGHPDNMLGNHWAWSVIPLPIPSSSGGEEKILQKIFSLLKNSREQSIMAFKRVPIFGGLPFLFHGGIMKSHSIAFSDFPGAPHKVRAWDAECLDASVHLNIPPGDMGMFCSSLSYDGRWKFILTIDGSVASSQKDADYLANLVTSYIIEMNV